MVKEGNFANQIKDGLNEESNGRLIGAFTSLSSYQQGLSRGSAEAGRGKTSIQVNGCVGDNDEGGDNLWRAAERDYSAM